MSEPILGFPNQLTILRMICAPVFVALTLDGRLHLAVAVFVLGAITDAFDGLIARFYKQRTVLGAILDPLADKMLLGSAFVALSFADAVRVHIPKWLTVVVLSRDAIIVVSALAIAFVSNRKGFAPTGLGKISTGAQMTCVALAFGANLMAFPQYLLEIVFAATGVFTVASGLHYLYRASSRRFVEPDHDA
ncbi:MAG: CDP-alcohol phosphatidyltransferase family protein [Vicinamibacteria bacterium]|nr:CDP-alcohol phosphatidyltransferase family protein [Vicinamibacteria bacterium]